MMLHFIAVNESSIRGASERVTLLACPAVFLKHALLDEPAVAPNQRSPLREQQMESDLTSGMGCKAITDAPH